ncbi:hypothetical protein C1H46_034915 [Malus baccata]|uniref:Uncharacterized protein n=1 Tax=Malus baccata TaxID=106549 RepID=A0A540KZA2_MALBA|nr:hypothetical protein C1H46_034915 [Malus baccata]
MPPSVRGTPYNHRICKLQLIPMALSSKRCNRNSQRIGSSIRRVMGGHKWDPVFNFP